jgi:hypothetical protein
VIYPPQMVLQHQLMKHHLRRASSDGVPRPEDPKPDNGLDQMLLQHL